MNEKFTLHLGDCIATMRDMPDACVDSIVTDPPYHLTTDKKGGSGAASVNLESPYGRARIGTGFMGMKWDGGDIAQSVEMWAEALRVLKPGGHLLAFSGSRTYHRMVCAIEDAGFEIRDQIMWVYGSGFPKSLDVSKAIDKARDDRAEIVRVTSFVADAADRAQKSRSDIDEAMGTSDMAGWWTSRLTHRCQCPKWDQWLALKAFIGFSDNMDAEVWRLNGRKGTPGNERADREVETPNTNAIFQPTQRVINAGTPVLDAARQWQGWGTALKPAHEPICVARKPLVGTVAANVLLHGTGALNIDACRVHSDDSAGYAYTVQRMAPGADQNKTGKTHMDGVAFEGQTKDGRWPANLIHDGSEEVLAAFPVSTSVGHTPGARGKGGLSTSGHAGQDAVDEARHDAGSAARFFYCAKADRADRNEGVFSGILPATAAGATMSEREGADWQARNGNHHPTVKPTDLMAYLCRLVTPPGGVVLDPFMGSGSTGKAAVLEGFRFVGIDMTPEYVEIARARIDFAARQGHQPGLI